MDRDAILTFTRSLLQEPSARKWTDAFLVDLINEGVEEVHGQIVRHVEGHWYQEEADSDTSIVADQSRYAWPDKGSRSMLRLDRVERVGISWPYDLEEIRKDDRHDYDDVASNDSENYPRYYYVEPPNIVIVPTPSIAITDAIRFHGTWEHGELSSGSSSPNFPSRYHRLPGYWAAMSARGFDETSPEYEAAMWRRGIASMVQDMATHEYGEPVDTSDWV